MAFVPFAGWENRVERFAIEEDVYLVLSGQLHVSHDSRIARSEKRLKLQLLDNERDSRDDKLDRGQVQPYATFKPSVPGDENRRGGKGR